MKTIVALCMFFAVVIYGISTYLGPDDIARCAEPSLGTCAPADVIVVVSGGDTNARVMEGVRLFKRGWGKRLVFSGAAADTTGLSNAQAMKEFATKLGISDSLISIEEFSRTTAENARNTNDVLKSETVKRVLVMTSAYHQRRAGLEFQAQLGPDVKVLNHPVSQDRQWSSLWWTTTIGWWLAVGELIKIALFYVGGTV
jgi:uncharacterized SAM-binding protein YcdF (DUF218 family)